MRPWTETLVWSLEESEVKDSPELLNRNSVECLQDSFPILSLPFCHQKKQKNCLVWRQIFKTNSPDDEM